MLQPGKPLSPRHRRLAELAAAGIKSGKIAQELGLTPARVSVLLSNTMIKKEIARLQERMFEEGLSERMKRLGHSALDIIDEHLNPDSQTKPQLRAETARWVLEKLTGKAVQTHDIGENMLGVLLDRLDGMKQAGEVLEIPALAGRAGTPAMSSEAPEEVTAPDPLSEERAKLSDWVLDNF